MRRNKLSDFTQVNRAGKIAMKLDDGESIVDVAICTEDPGRASDDGARPVHPLPVPEVRVFKGRDSMGVRGITLDSEDRVISLSILRHFEAGGDERTAYLKMSRAVNGEANGENEVDLGEEGRQRRCRRTRAGPLRFHVGRRTIHPDDLAERLRQALVILRVPHHRTRRQRHRRHGGQRPQRARWSPPSPWTSRTRSCW